MHTIDEHHEFWDFGPITISRHYQIVRHSIIGLPTETNCFPTEHDAHRFFKTLLTDHQENFFEAIEKLSHRSDPEFLEKLYQTGLDLTGKYKKQLLENEE